MVTDLLSAAAVALSEAKAGGGDSVRVARVGEEDRVVAGSFDVLQGLVIAVDTKDRYPKRHSEDVARYAVFLAQRIGLDEETQRTIQLAGLLHDIGKIGIPDVVLRKPKRLTDDEFADVQAARGAWATRSSATSRTSASCAPASATTTSAGTGTATSTAWGARRSRSSAASWRWPTPSAR